jgi:anti-sigma regulatory factor (Ser/Thr protein kinase)
MLSSTEMKQGCIMMLPNAFFAGFKWQRQLVFRNKLTMHTAYDRKDNAEPASITALAVSK